MIDKLATNTCSEWLGLHPLTQDYFEYLISENKIVLAQAYDIVKEIIIDEKNIVDKVKFMSCSEWLQLHPRTQDCLQILINEQKIAAAQADYVVKEIIIDERGVTYKNLDVCAYDLWCDLRDIPGHFILAKISEFDPNSEIGKFREGKYQQWRHNLATMINNKSINWDRQKKVFKFSNVQDCKEWLLEKLATDGLIKK